MSRYFLVKLDNDSRATRLGIQAVLADNHYKATAVIEMTEPYFEGRDGKTFKADRDLLDLKQQTVSANLDK